MSVSFDTLRAEGDHRALIRKTTKATAWLLPLTVDLPEKLLESDGTLINLADEGARPVGMVTPDGYEFSREIESSDVDALGYASPARTDITRVPRSISFTPLQSFQKHLTELKYGVDLSDITQDKDTGEVVFDEPELPVAQEYRLIVIASDGATTEEWIFGKGYGRVKLTGGGSETWGQEGAVSSQITLGVFTDDEIGTPVRHYFGGDGAKKYSDVLGYTQSE